MEKAVKFKSLAEGERFHFFHDLTSVYVKVDEHRYGLGSRAWPIHSTSALVYRPRFQDEQEEAKAA